MNRTGRIALLATFVLLLGCSFVLAGTPKKIKIGLMFGMTGAASPIGPVQLDGAKLAIDEINNAGGVKFGKEKVKIEYVTKDDETKPDVAVRRFRELVYDEKVNAIVGQTFAPISGALNKEVARTPVAYFPVNVVSLSMFQKDEIAPTTFSVHGSAYAAGYASAAYVINKLKIKKIAFFAPAYAFGWDQWKGAQAAIKKYKAEVFYKESPVGVSDYTPYLLEIESKKPDIIMLAHWGVDAINVLKQVNETGLKSKTKVWFNWMTNVFGKGVPPEALDGVYSLMSWYWDMSGFEDQKIVAKSQSFTNEFMKKYNYPPDPYSAMAYLGVKEAIRGIELSKSTNAADIAKALQKHPRFDSMKGPGEWRADHQASFKYNAFVVIGNGTQRKNEWDLVKIIDVYTGEDYLPNLKELGY